MSENSNIQEKIFTLIMGAALGGSGGYHLGGKGEDLPVTAVSIQDCAPFSQHAREHEQHTCQALINSIRAQCDCSE